MFFFKKNKKKNDVMDFVVDADKKVAEAYRNNDTREIRDVVTADVYNSLKLDITARKNYDDPKFESENYMERSYNIVSENDDVAVVKRDIIFKTIKNLGRAYATGVNFSELITVSKKDGFAITAIAAA